MNKKTFFLLTSFEFDKRFHNGVSKVYQILCVENNCCLKIVNLDFLKDHIPENYGEFLIIAGGDGTIHRVMNAIPEEAFDKYIFGIIPAGTANEFAKFLKIPINLNEALELIINQKKIYKEHLGVVNGEYRFATGLLYGIESQVLRFTPIRAKHFLGPLAFKIGLIIFFLRSLTTERFLKGFKINSRSFRTYYLLINNASLISKNFKKTEIVNENRNLFSIIYLHSKIKSFDILRASFKRSFSLNVLKDSSLYYEQLLNLTLEFEDTLEFMLDGEVYELDSPIKIEFFGKPINVISG